MAYCTILLLFPRPWIPSLPRVAITKTDPQPTVFKRSIYFEETAIAFGLLAFLCFHISFQNFRTTVARTFGKKMENQWGIPIDNFVILFSPQTHITHACVSLPFLLVGRAGIAGEKKLWRLLWRLYCNWSVILTVARLEATEATGSPDPS